MSNYHDLSTSSNNETKAGFQFEFFCESCGDTWRSPFRAYRRGRLTGWLRRFDFLYTHLHSVGHASGAVADAGAVKARQGALDDVLRLAATRFHRCGTCGHWVCDGCVDAHTGECRDCSGRAAVRCAAPGGGAADASSPATALAGAATARAVCPQCQTPSEGGRFCHDCGFDMASTHKSCPGCGTTVSRETHFCPDCGHGF